MSEHRSSLLFDMNWRFPVEPELHSRGIRVIAGVDEAGRGSLAGPVVSAAVILDPDDPIDGIRDSKQLRPAVRERLAGAIRQRALAWAVEFSHREVIDRLNVLEATKLSMRRAIENLRVRPELILIDAVRLSDLSVNSMSLIKGDQLSVNVGAASILAKVERDAWMTGIASGYPGYGFEIHKGYGTRRHLLKLRELGPCEIHRCTYKPVIEAVENGRLQ